MNHGNAALKLDGSLVPLGQMRLAAPGEMLGTRALGSCVAIAMRDVSGKAAGLAHCMLPLSQLDPGTARLEPCTFTDSGIVALRDAVLDAGARIGGIEAFLIGGAALLGDANTLRMGARNVQVARMLLEQFEISVAGEAVGGTLPRSVWFDGNEGWADVFCAGRTERLRSA